MLDAEDNSKTSNGVEDGARELRTSPDLAACDSRRWLSHVPCIGIVTLAQFLSLQLNAVYVNPGARLLFVESVDPTLYT